MKAKNDARVYIVGAGFAGKMLARELDEKKIFGRPVAFLDDNPALIGSRIDGVPVFGPIDSVTPLLKHEPYDEAIVAMPSAPKSRIKEIYDLLAASGFARIRILPGISQIIEGPAHLIQAREIDPLDILGRTPITISLRESLSYLRGKRVLITGAGGSIGSELARQLLSGGAERLYLFGHGENSIYQIDRELRLLQSEGVGEKATIVPIIGELKDRSHLDWLLPKTRCDVIFHCAAYKHVPLMEENPVAAVENNVFGTENLIEAALKAGVKRFVLISTDKAVEPVSVYGVSKMLCEKLVLQASGRAENSRSFMFVRFGNVLGSRGSILPLFMEQIKAGGPVTVTDEHMKRFFMTIPEACSLVLKTGGVGENGCSYLLDMGEPIRILDIAEQIIRFSGLTPGTDIPIRIIGARKGERLEEPLWTEEEAPKKTAHEGILRLERTQSGFNLGEVLDQLRPVCFYDGTKPALYRNARYLTDFLCAKVPSLQEFYHEIGK